MSKVAKLAVSSALLIGGAEVAAEQPAAIVELESPLARAEPLQAYLRQPEGVVPYPAVVLLHGCNGNWKRLDERWGKRIASWGYVTLTVDSFGPRGIDNTCTSGAPVEMALDAYRALHFLAQQSFVDATRVAALGFSQGGWLALTSVERGVIEDSARNKFRAAVAFYPPCLDFKDNMTVPTLILIGELDDWMPAEECRDLVEGRDSFGISRQKGMGVPVRLIVYASAYHAFDVPELRNPVEFFGHHLEYNRAAADQSIDALQNFLLATIGGNEQAKDKPDRQTKR
ncbi:MAG: dienelactone hydrolase family protein [Bradyrhizobium sp.]|nr:dienelactone hydrolase family protein [Bradyrhizobium sp.]